MYLTSKYLHNQKADGTRAISNGPHEKHEEKHRHEKHNPTDGSSSPCPEEDSPLVSSEFEYSTVTTATVHEHECTNG